MRLLLQHDEPLFHHQFRQFYVNSSLPQIPLLQQYDRYIKLRGLSNELLDDILPRIRRQLSLKTSHARLHEEAPTRGDIDWQRTIERNWSHAPGHPPLQFDTRLRQRTLETPENILVVAILLVYRQEIQQAMQESFADEILSGDEQQRLTSADKRAERELAAAYARVLIPQARHVDIALLAQQVATHLRPGPTPYRDLLHWWQRFSQFRAGRASEQQAIAIASKRRDEKTDAWLYELWIALEYVHLFHTQGSIQPADIKIETDRLQYTFCWQQRQFRFIYNRQLETATGFQSGWEHAPASRPDYTIERATPLEIRHQGELIWREPSFVLDAKYYLSGSDPAITHEPIKKLLGDMTLLGAQTGVLFFPHIAEPTAAQPMTRTIRQSGAQYSPAGTTGKHIHLYHLEPTMPHESLQQRLSSTLDLALTILPERPEPACRGIWLDPDTINASQSNHTAATILCFKPHIGPNVFDLVNIDTDCLKNPRLCHVIGQPIVPPFIIRATDQEQLARQSLTLRERTNARLRNAEAQDNEARAEQLRAYIFSGIGHATEQYVKLFGDTRSIEENFERWVFGEHWQRHRQSLSEAARNSLISGEYVWQNAQGVDLQDWAAPAIQYCRALEFELKRRLYLPCQQRYTFSKAGFTLGAIIYAYEKRDGNWQAFCQRILDSGSSIRDFEALVQRMANEAIKEKRNAIAHGGVITCQLAQELRESIIGGRSKPGILCWIVEHIHTT